MNNFEYADATDVSAAISLMVKGAAFKAGGVDLVDLMKERIAQPTRIINIRDIRSLDYIREENGVLKIGPLATLAKLADDKTVREKYAALADAAGRAATPQVRNMATLGGNLLQRPRCWYFRNEQFNCRKKGGEKCFAQDGENQYHAIFNNGLCAIVHPSATACALVALGAKIELTGAKDAKRDVLLEEFFTPPNVDLHRENSIGVGEIITEIRVPALAANTRSAYFKLGEKESFDWPIAEVAAVITTEAGVCKLASIVLGAASPIPHRAVEAEKFLLGQKIDETSTTAAAKAALAAATPLTQNAYKIHVFETMIRRTILAAADVGGGAP